MTEDDAIDKMREMFDEYENCQRCDLCKPVGRERIAMVFGGGNINADVMIIGDSPRKLDEAAATPLSPDSPPGFLVDRYLESMQTSREKVWIDQVVSCRATKTDDPRSERPPNKDETAACRPRIHEVIRIVDPKVILLLGSHALRLARKWGDFLDKETAPFRSGISVVARNPDPPRLVVEVPGIFGPVRYEAYATFHPAHILRLKEADFKKPNNDAHRAFETWRHVFRVVDVGNYINRGIKPITRGVDIS